MSVRTRLRRRLGKYRLQKLAERDLDAFEAENRSLIQACEEAELAFEFASSPETFSRRASYLELVELGREGLERLCEQRLAELGADAGRYEEEFARAVLRRLSRFAPGLDLPAN
jgi:hypothetical protein